MKPHALGDPEVPQIGQVGGRRVAGRPRHGIAFVKEQPRHIGPVLSGHAAHERRPHGSATHRPGLAAAGAEPGRPRSLTTGPDSWPSAVADSQLGGLIIPRLVQLSAVGALAAETIEVCLHHLAPRARRSSAGDASRACPAPCRISSEMMHLERAEIARVDLDQDAARAPVDALLVRRPARARRSRGRPRRRRARRTRAPSVPRRWPSRNRRARPAAAIRHMPSTIVARMAPVAPGVEIAEIQAAPAARAGSRATARVILRVTKVSPRIGLSWLNRMPLQA